MSAPSGLFGGRAAAGGGAQDAQKQAVFAQVKAICVPLLEAARAPSFAQTTRNAIDLLERLAAQLRRTPPAAFTPALANYAFFPLSSLLRPPLDGHDRGDRVLEATMQALAALVDKWRAVGMEPRVRQELWIMTALTLGGPLDPSGPGKGGAASKGKGKAVERTEESKLAMVEVLLALMRPAEGEEQKEDDDEEDPLGERIDWSRVDAADPSTLGNGGPQRPRDPPPPVPILFHTLTTLLALAAEPTSLLQLQLSSLGALRILVADYLAHPVPSATLPTPSTGPSPLLTTALPGTASTLSRIALSMPSSSRTEYGKSTRRQASAVVVAALQTLSLLILETVGDGVTCELREGSGGVIGEEMPAATLEELVETKLGELALVADEDDGAEEATPPPDDPPAAAPPPTGPTIPTPAWLRFTLTSLTTLFAALSPLSTHDSPVVRTALVSFLSHVLSHCALTLGEHAEILLEGLLALASDSWDDVRLPARRALLAAFAQPVDAARTPSHPLALAARIVQRRLAALPGALRRQDEHSVRRGAGIVRAALELLPRVAPAASPLHGVEKWSWALLGALELERVPGAGRGADGGMALAWITDAADAPSTSAEGASATAYPPVRLRGVGEADTARALEALWEALGRACAAGEQEGEVVDQFLGVALGPRRDEPAAASALWVVDGVLRGMRVDAQPSKAQKKVLKRVARAVLALMEDLEEASAEDEPLQADAAADVPQHDLLAVEEETEPGAAIRLVEHKRGVTAMPSLEAYNPVAALATTRDTRASHHLLLSSFSLRLLATTASLLTTAFQPFLMQSLYHVLAHLSPSTHAFLRAHAQHALALISASTAYASPQNLVLSNVDYVVNSVSQRLSGARLEPNAPLVLVEMIRLVGRPIVPMVQDLVDDVFEALDDYHGYEDVTVGLWAVLDALLKVMVEDLPPQPEGDGPRITDATKDVPRPDAEADWRAFEDWLAQRHDPPISSEPALPDDLPSSNPQQPFSTLHPEAPPAAETPADPSFASDTPAPPTRPQRVTAQILSKALFFLSHPSAFLRARVLSLMASSVPLLLLPSLSAAPGGDKEATREADLLPVIHRAWPAILARLSPPPREEPPVARAAVALVRALANHAGGFMARRIGADVWPRFLALLSAAPAREDARGMGRYSGRHQLHRDVLAAMGDVVAGVPLREQQLWDGALAARGFLALSVEPELRALAASALRGMGRQNADAVWVVLRGTSGGEGAEGLPRWLRRGWEGTEWGEEMQAVLDGL